MFAAVASLTRCRGRWLRRPPAAWLASLPIIVVLVATPSAQQLQTAFNAAPVLAPDDALPTPTDIDLLVGRSTVINVGATIARVSLTVPDVADAMVTAPSQILIHGKQPGTISLFVWDRGGAIKTYEVNVRRDLDALKDHLKQLFPGEPITVIGSGKDVVLSGTVSGQYAIEKAADVAGGYVDKKENVVNLLKQQEGIASNQVMLRVRFAEVSRSAIQELGANFFTGATGYKGKGWVASPSTGQFPGANYDSFNSQHDLKTGELLGTSGSVTLSDFLNVFVFSHKYNVGAVVRALSDKGLFQSLAEPNLIATNGKEASFLAGGEYPYPVAQGGGAGATSISIQFKEFGIRLRFTPTVLGGDLVNLKVEPEVSALDFSNAITLEGFRVPALTTRRTSTEVELRDGQTFAIAGLLNNTVNDALRKIPGIGDIPILGWLFKSRGIQKNQTELVVMITPTIMRKGSTGVSEGLPSMVEPFLSAPKRRLPAPPPYVGSPRYPANREQPRDRNMSGVVVPAPTTAAVPAPAPATSASAGTLVPSTSAASDAAPAPTVVRTERDEKEEREAAKAAARERERAEKLARERAKREAKAAKEAEEAARKQAEEDAQREREVAEAAARLKAAEAALEKAKGKKDQE